MYSLNKVFIVGRIGSDIDLKYTQSDTPVVNFSVATDETYESDGEKIKKTEWHKCTAWKKTAEIVSKICQKGDRVFIEGKNQTRVWEKDGIKQYSTEIVVLNVINFN